MVAPEWGVFNVMQQRRLDVAPSQVIAEAVDQAVVADQLGFDCCWFPEHHTSNYSLCPSPLMMVAHCAGLTRDIRLGSAVIVAPLHQPARVLAEIGLADGLCGGRLNLGIGAGYQDFEFRRFGVDLADCKAMTLEMIEMIQTGLGGRSFSFQGTHYQQQDTHINVRAVGQELPPIYLVGNDPRFHRIAAECGYTVFISGLLGSTRRVAKLREHVAGSYVEAGKDPSNLPLALLRYMFVGENKADVERYVECARYQSRLAYRLSTRTETVRGEHIIEEEPFEGEPSMETLLASLIVGDVETCIERALAEIRAVRPTEIAIQAKLGDLDHSLAMRSLELFQEKVRPAIEAELARPAAAAREA